MEKQKNEKRVKEEDQRKQELISKEQKVISDKKEALCKLINEQERKESEQMLEQETAKQLISEASSELSVSLKKNDLSGAKVAQVMLSAGDLKLQETSKQLLSI